jgi:AAA+ superfamily predicted ATPase
MKTIAFFNNKGGVGKTSLVYHLAMEDYKPMFHLRPADGAIGAHVAAVADCAGDFLQLADRLAASTGLALPEPELW